MHASFEDVWDAFNSVVPWEKHHRSSAFRSRSSPMTQNTATILILFLPTQMKCPFHLSLDKTVSDGRN